MNSNKAMNKLIWLNVAALICFVNCQMPTAAVTAPAEKRNEESITPSDSGNSSSRSSNRSVSSGDSTSAGGGPVIDLTHVLASGIPDFHGHPDAFQYKMLFTIAKDGFADGQISMPEHIGTHVDAPCHFSAGSPSIDEMPAANMVVPCVVIDVRDEARKNPDYCVTAEKISEFEKGGAIPEHSAVLLLTGWSDRWSDPAAYRNPDSAGVMHFPGFTTEAADYLANKRQVNYLGIDTLSLDPGNSKEYGVHHLTLKKGMHLIENLDALDKLPARGATLVCAPLRIKGGTGSPARVFAILP